MIVEIRLFATLRNYFPEIPGGVLTLEAAETATVGDIVAKLKIAPEEIKIIMVNGIHAEPEQSLKNGDRIGLFPPVGGG